MQSKINIKDKSERDKQVKVSPFRKEIRKTEPHKHNSYLEIIYLSKGSGIHSIDRNTFQIEPPIVFFVKKEQVHHWNIETLPDGYVAIIKKGWVDKSYDEELKKLLSELSRYSSLKIKDTVVIETIFNLLTRENNFTTIEGLLKALFSKIVETAEPHIINSPYRNNLYQSLIELLSKSEELKNSVSHYAGLLHTTPQNLNHICRQSSGQSASVIIGEHLIAEAKRLLFYTDNTVSEVSFGLGFKDISHFVKYFKRHTGDTPHAFRRRP
ncbi:MAG: helix-turn-helix domain-containing protein [Chitinophagaceae bacterium]|nr:helix-turn-helix domain-containing protein [Chitinophagaceae bacterium]